MDVLPGHLTFFIFTATRLLESNEDLRVSEVKEALSNKAIIDLMNQKFPYPKTDFSLYEGEVAESVNEMLSEAVTDQAYHTSGLCYMIDTCSECIQSFCKSAKDVNKENDRSLLESLKIIMDSETLEQAVYALGRVSVFCRAVNRRLIDIELDQLCSLPFNHPNELDLIYIKEVSTRCFDDLSKLIN